MPKGALDLALFLESDRMGHFLGALTQARLDEQRGVVENEKRRGDNAPYAIAQDLITKATYPSDHPYGHTTIGSMKDLDAASLDQVKAWFSTYYGPSNAVVALSGDITPEEAKAKMEKYFSALPPGQPVAHPKVWIAKRTGNHREIAYDRVAAPRLTKVWNAPQYGDKDVGLLDLFGDVLTLDRTSRLTKRLVYDEQLATSVAAGAGGNEIAGRFSVNVMGKPGVDMEKVERIVDEEIAKLVKDGPTASELAKARAENTAALARGLESVASKANQLATAQTYTGDPSAWRRNFDVERVATPAQIVQAAKTWLTDGSYSLTILPFEYRAEGQDADRSKMPLPAGVTPVTFPSIQHATLSNGLKIMLVERHDAPLVSVDLLINTAYAADFAQLKPGTGNISVGLMDEATKSRSREVLTDQLARLGANISSGGGGEQSTVSLSALTPTLDPALTIFADIIRNPAYAQADVDRVKQQQIASLKSARVQPASMASRVTAAIIYGKDHPLGRLTSEASISAISRADLVAFHDRWFQPDNATLVVVGDTTLAAIKPKLEAALGSWKTSAPTPRITVLMPPTPAKPVVYLVDKPGAPQSYILAALPAAPRTNSDAEFQLAAFNTNFGGNFTSRINMNLREEKGWSYGVSSGVAGGRGPRTFRIIAEVQTNKTKESIAELKKELTDALDARPITAAEIATSVNNSIMGLASRWETSADVTAAVEELVSFNLPDDYWNSYAGRLKAVTPPQALAAGKTLVPAQTFAWVVVGDRAKVEAGLKELGMEVKIVDADGNPVG